MNHSNTNNGSNRPQLPPPPALTLGDIYYVLFRHKWVIIILSLAGIMAAAGIYFLHRPVYLSQAEVLIQYVPQPTSQAVEGDNKKVIVPDTRSQSIINSEIQIMTSLDLAEKAVQNIGASNILYLAGGGTNPISAANLLQNNLDASPAGRDSAVIVLTLRHPNRQIVQPLLQEIVDDYFERHYEIHSSLGQYDAQLIRERATLRSQLSETGKQLADLKNKAKMISLEDSKKNLADMIAKVTSSILDAQAQLAGYEAALNHSTNNASALAAIGETNNPDLLASPSLKETYRDINTRLQELRKKKQDYFAQGFTIHNVLVTEVNSLIAKVEKEKLNLETENPQLMESEDVGEAAAPRTLTPSQQEGQIIVLQAKIKAWQTQLEQLQVQATHLNNLSLKISELENEQAIQQANYHNLSVSLEKSHIDKGLDLGKAPNIKWVQKPSPPMRDKQKTYKTAGIAALAGIMAGLAWAFLIEMFLDRRIKRPIEIETKLKLPLLLAIPNVSRNGHKHLLPHTARRQLPMPSSSRNGKPAEAADETGTTNGAVQVVSLEKNHFLHPYCEALRDRLIVQFEVENLTHKPKLVAVTGANAGAGVSTIAAGLAASLSETGEGNVLLVDMNLENGAAQHFYKGNASCGLDAALKNETMESALVQENLYVVTGNAPNDKNEELSLILPKRFATLVPQLKASVYDYIIFDLPHVSQTSITMRLARFMDKTLLVAESERSSRETIALANKKLSETGAAVTILLNKTRNYIPPRLYQESLSD